MAAVSRAVVCRSGMTAAKKAVALATLNKSSMSSEAVTHTGQVWEETDVRQTRFVRAAKQTNQRWAIDLVKDVPPKAVKGRTVACDGGPKEALGHPKIYINLDEPGIHSCIYCGLQYFKDDSH